MKYLTNCASNYYPYISIMKIGILTQPLKYNYGGVMQAYALQSFLSQNGYESIVINRLYSPKERRESFVFVVKQMIKAIVYGKPQIELFINSHIHLSRPIYSTSDLKNIVHELNIDTIIVGSDQVWRPNISPCITNYFGDFIGDDSINCMSYAASFGYDTWTFSESDTQICKSLIKKFKAVSVREASGIELCRDYLNVEASLTLDPTLIVDRKLYDVIIEHDNVKNTPGDMFCFFLDYDDNYLKFVGEIAKSNGLSPFSLSSYRGKYYKPSPAQWLKSIRDAKLVLTDSFHGTVFSIIFHKDFYVLPNRWRGITRLHSLLNMFDLSDRLLSTETLSRGCDIVKIDWDSVELKLSELRNQSKSFLLENLS